MSTAVVTTTINPAPRAYEEYAKQADLIIAADINTPPELNDFTRKIGATALVTAYQEVENPLWSSIVGWKTIQRRNAAIMHAFRLGYDIIITVDDDNFPGTDFVAMHEAILTGKLKTHQRAIPLCRDERWVNVGELSRPETWQRGTPYGVDARLRLKVELGDAPDFAVSQSLVLGSPDTDAITRLTTGDPVITDFVGNTFIRPGPNVHFAFNSQATGWIRDFAPLMAVLPDVGRFDDIIGSFIAQRILSEFGYAIHFGKPLVTQERNPHDYLKDLADEVWGIKNTFRVVEALDAADLDDYDDPCSMYDRLSYVLQGILPHKTVAFMRGWARTWKEAL